MIPMKDFLKNKPKDDSNDVTNESFVENSIENSAWYTIEKNHVSLISENVEKVIKIETDLIDDCMWESRIDIAKDVKQSSSSLPFQINQDASSNNLNSNHKRINFQKIFCCNVCEQSFDLELNLIDHMEEHKEQIQNVSSSTSDLVHDGVNPLKTFSCDVCEQNFALDLDFKNHMKEHTEKTKDASNSNFDSNFININSPKKFDCEICEESFALDLDLMNHNEEKHKTQTEENCAFKCSFCGKDFKLNFVLNRHIEKYHTLNKVHEIRKYECKICKNFIDEIDYNEHIKTHENNTEKDVDHILNLKLCKLNGVWKSKPNVGFKCNLCVKKFQNEIDLIEHIKIHKHDYTLSPNENNIVSKSTVELDDVIEQSENTTSFDCEKCNLKFDKKQNLDLHVVYCTKSSRNIWNKFLGAQNNFKVSFICTTCETDFNSSTLLKNHMTLGCKLYNCTFCDNDFRTKDLWLKHVDDCKKLKNCVRSMINTNKTSINETHTQNAIESNCSLITKQEKNHSTKVTVKKTSDLMDKVNENRLSLPSLSSNSIENNSSSNAKLLRNLCPDVSVKVNTDNSFTINSNKSTIQSGSHSLIASSLNLVTNPIKTMRANFTENNNAHSPDIINTNDITLLPYVPHNLNIKKENNLDSTIIEQNSLNNINKANINNITVYTLPENTFNNNIMHNDGSINMEVENGLNTNVIERKFSDTMNEVISQESNVQSVRNKVIVKQEPREDPVNDNSGYTDKETIYYSIKILPKNRHLSLLSNNQNYSEQTLEKIIVYMCKICKTSLADIHSLALHMSEHQECTMHECVVCGITFETVLNWTSHMTRHQQQLDICSESNDLVNSMSRKPQITIETVEKEKSENSSSLKHKLKDSSAYILSNLNINVTNSNKSHVNPALMTNTNLPIKLKSFACNYCDRTFSGQGPLTNHEKAHINSDKNKMLNEVEEETDIICDPQEENTQINPSNNVLTKRKILTATKRFVCDYCRKRFTKQCYWTNHMRFVHRINSTYLGSKPTISKKLGLKSLTNEIDSINGLPSVNISKEYNSITEQNDNAPITIDTNLNNSLSGTTEKKSFCTICQKQFAHIGAYTSHMHVHSNDRPYSCQYCDRKFSMKGPFTLHIRNHKNKGEVENTEISNLSPIKVEMTEEEQENGYNSSEFVNSTFNNNPSCTNLIKKNRMWFICDCCDKKFSTPFQLVSHRRTQHDNRPYVCKICNKTYIVRHRWNRHLKSHYLRNNLKNVKSDQLTTIPNMVNNNLKIEHHNQFKCGYCKKEYNLIYHWKKHLSFNKECRRHSKRNLPEFTSVQAKDHFVKARFECRICKKTYSTDYNRKVHVMNVHKVLDTSSNLVTNVNLDEKIQQIILPVTTLQKINTNKKKRHRNSDNTDFKCDLCGKCYSNSANLSRHRNIIHTKVNASTTCNICGRTFKHKYSFREHCRSKHSFLLSNNNKANTNKNSNNSHNVITINKNITVQYLCKICNMKFADNIALQKHTKTSHAVNKYKCNDCGQYFETNVILGKHILENHNVKTTPNRHNENNTVVKSSLQTTIENPVKCNICFKSLSSLTYLNNHMRLHSGDKPFKCEFCNETFRFKPNLKMHIKKHFEATKE